MSTSMATTSITFPSTLFTTKAYKTHTHISLTFTPKPFKPLISSNPSSHSLQTKLRSTPLTTGVIEDLGWSEEEQPDGSEWEGDEDGVTLAAGEPEGEEEGGENGEYPEPSEEAKIFVGNLPFDVDSERLARMFERAGVVEIAEVIYNRETDQSRGFGFVTMSTAEEAQKAVGMLHRYDVGGRLLTVNIAAPRGTRPERSEEVEASFKLYVGNLPWQVDDARLEQIFSEQGKVLDAKVIFDRETGRSRGFGFVQMASKAEMDDAIAALDGQSLDGRAIRVNVAEERSRRSF